MKQLIVLAGATGNLGHRIALALLGKGAAVRAIVRPGTSVEKLNKLKDTGAAVVTTGLQDLPALTDACAGAYCVVSALQGLHDVIVDDQKTLLDAAIAAGVPRFIPSDYSTDFTRLPDGENRNFDLRKEFHQYLDKAPVAATAIYNGAFADILTYNTPLLDLKQKTIGYWGDNPGWQMDFTTMDDTAAYTAAVALDNNTPPQLRIAGFQVSPDALLAIANATPGNTFKLVAMGSLDAFAGYIKQQRAADPAGEDELYPKWQSAQYMHGMFSTHHQSLDNSRYPELNWTSAASFIKPLL